MSSHNAQRDVVSDSLSSNWCVAGTANFEMTMLVETWSSGRWLAVSGVFIGLATYPQV